MPRTRRPADAAAAVAAVAPARPKRTRSRAAVAAPPAEPVALLSHPVELEPAADAEPVVAVTVTAGADPATPAIRQYLTFVVDGQEFGIEIHNVQEIRGFSNVTPLPNTPPHIKGLMNLRGAVIPIFDLRAWFGGGQAECTRTSVIVTVTVGERLVGLLVDAVSDVLDVEGRSLAPPPDLGPGVDTTLLAGLATVGERLVAVIKVDELVGGMMAA
ncbi:MAG: purine-binding chemotaxis protein CheW [Candidatus Eisenbacteria bacterium]|nr:purine-binding chemotaxis protein CheW [Candidatus Eisenbacteria bacterium]